MEKFKIFKKLQSVIVMILMLLIPLEFFGCKEDKTEDYPNFTAYECKMGDMSWSPIPIIKKGPFSDHGMVFTKMVYLVGGRLIAHPHVLEHNGYLLITFAGDSKQKIEVAKVKITDLNNINMD